MFNKPCDLDHEDSMTLTGCTLLYQTWSQTFSGSEDNGWTSIYREFDLSDLDFEDTNETFPQHSDFRYCTSISSLAAKTSVVKKITSRKK